VLERAERSAEPVNPFAVRLDERARRAAAAADAALAKDGRLLLEVMYAGDLFEHLQWDTLYHEHLTFYSLTTISILLERYGFRVLANS